MDISKVISDLNRKRECLHEAIISLEKLSQMGAPRRGRPPAWARLAGVQAPRSRNGKNGSLSAAESSSPEA
jgi:hypothetical protein